MIGLSATATVAGLQPRQVSILNSAPTHRQSASHIFSKMVLDIKMVIPDHCKFSLVPVISLQYLPPLNDTYQHHYKSNYEQNMD